MLVRNWMTNEVVTVSVTDSMARAARLMKDYNIRRLPVMKHEKVVGMVTDHDIMRASASDATTLEVHELVYLLDKLTVKKIMTPNPLMTSENHSVDEAAQVMLERKISGLPVLNGHDRLCGIITMSDVSRALLSLTGHPKRGILFGFVLDNRPGSIREAADVIRKYGGRIVSILSHLERLLDGDRTVYIRMYGVDRSKLDLLVDELQARFTLLYMIDYRTNRRQIYE